MDKFSSICLSAMAIFIPMILYEIANNIKDLVKELRDIKKILRNK